MTKAAYGELINKVRKLCARPIGASLNETAELLENKKNVASVYITTLVKSGEVTKAGVYGFFRYFKDAKKAAEFDAKAKAEWAIHVQLMAKKKSETKARKGREKRAKAREASGIPPAAYNRQPKQAKLIKRATNISLQTKQQAIEQLLQHKAAKIEWPEHVQIQRIPTPVDMRFKAEPGYRGSFVQEWHERRAA